MGLRKDIYEREEKVTRLFTASTTTRIFASKRYTAAS